MSGIGLTSKNSQSHVHSNCRMSWPEIATLAMAGMKQTYPSKRGNKAIIVGNKSMRGGILVEFRKVNSIVLVLKTLELRKNCSG